MKQNDILTVAVIAISGFVVSLILCNVLLGDPDEKSVSFTTIEPISNEIAEPNPEVFNLKAINPTVEVYVGQCEDWDRNGTIDDAEWQACHNTEENGTDNGSGGGASSSEGE
ncbi:hypothetical protein IJI91_01530 [Candidatus Saccharibacteria bacterium]|nr:hypothetical protein [Candidatus Saccharibacteria bacterium]